MSQGDRFRYSFGLRAVSYGVRLSYLGWAVSQGTCPCDLFLQNALHIAVQYDTLDSRGEKVYERFELDFQKAVFEWDNNKEAANFKKHGIHFKTAVKVFLDPHKLIRYDDEHMEEERYNILGKVGRVLFVVCAFRNENVVRLISARIASVPEKERYEYGEDEL